MHAGGRGGGEHDPRAFQALATRGRPSSRQRPGPAGSGSVAFWERRAETLLKGILVKWAESVLPSDDGDEVLFSKRRGQHSVSFRGS